MTSKTDARIRAAYESVGAPDEPLDPTKWLREQMREVSNEVSVTNPCASIATSKTRSSLQDLNWRLALLLTAQGRRRRSSRDDS